MASCDVVGGIVLVDSLVELLVKLLVDLLVELLVKLLAASKTAVSYQNNKTVRQYLILITF